MFRVQVKTRKNNTKSIRKQISDDTFSTIEQAQVFITKCIQRQYRLCMRGWGLTAMDVAEKSEIETTALYQSACIAFDCTAIRLDFKIIEE